MVLAMCIELKKKNKRKSCVRWTRITRLRMMSTSIRAKKEQEKITDGTVKRKRKKSSETVVSGDKKNNRLVYRRWQTKIRDYGRRRSEKKCRRFKHYPRTYLPTSYTFVYIHIDTNTGAIQTINMHMTICRWYSRKEKEMAFSIGHENVNQCRMG